MRPLYDYGDCQPPEAFTDAECAMCGRTFPAKDLFKVMDKDGDMVRACGSCRARLEVESELG